MPDQITTVTLREIAKIFVGRPVAQYGTLVEEGGDVAYVTGEDLQHDSLSVGALRRLSQTAPIPESARLAEGDVLIPSVFRKPRSHVVPVEAVGAVPSSSVLIVRPLGKGHTSEFLAEFFSSDAFLGVASSLSATMNDMVRLSVAGLGVIPIPSYSAGLLRDFALIRDEERMLRVRAEELRKVTQSFLGFDSEARLREELDRVRLSSRLVADSLREASDFDFQVRSFFHFPIAFPYRLIDLEVDPMRAQYQLHQVAERITAYLASLLLSLSQPYSADLGRYLKRALGGNGATFGNWFKIVEMVLSNIDGSSSPLHRALSRLVQDRGHGSFLSKLELLLKSRDDFHHRPGVGAFTGTAAATREAEIRDGLSAVLEHLTFLCEHPLYLPLDFDLNRNRNGIDTVALRYIGDHPGMKKVSLTTSEPVRKNDLYLAIHGEPKWRSLWPFITVSECPHCKARETYYVDRWKPGQAAVMSSFERGHREESQEVGKGLDELLA